MFSATLAAMVTKLMPTSAPQDASGFATVQASSAVQPHPARLKSHPERAMQVPAERMSAVSDWLLTPTSPDSLALGRGIDWRKDRAEGEGALEDNVDLVGEGARDALVVTEAAQTEASFWMSDLWVQVGPITAGASESAGSAAAGSAAAASGAVTAPVLTQVLPILLGFGYVGLGIALVRSADEKLPTNHDPVLVKRLNAQTAVVGEAFSFSLDRTSFLDPDGDVLQWSLGPIRDAQGNLVELGWLQFNPVTLELSGTPTALALGEYRITVRVTDPGLLQATDTFTFRVDTNSTLFDGYLKHALIFRDQDSDGVWLHEPIRSIRFVTDAVGKVQLDILGFEDLNGDGVFNAEPWALSNSAGVAPPVGGVGVMRSAAWEYGGTVDGVSIRTVDISTGKEFKSSLSAPQGSSVMSPLTTLVTAQLGVDPGASSAAQIAKASSDVVSLLFPGLTGAVDLLNLDPVKELGTGATGLSASIALQVQSAGQQVANILQVAVAAARAGGVVNLSSVTSAVTGSLLQSAAGGQLDLGNAASISSAIGAIADLVSDPAAKQLITQQSLSIAQTIAAVNNSIDQFTQSAVGDIAAGRAVNVAAILTDTTAFQLVAQSTLADRVSTAVGNPSSFSAGAFEINVEEEVERVRDQVQQVLVPSDGNQAPVLTPGIVSGTIQEHSPILLRGSIAFADANQADRPLGFVLSRSVTGVTADGSALTLSAEATHVLRDGFAISPRSSNSNSGVIDWTYDIAASAIDFLAQGTVLTLSFTVRIEDLKGGFANQSVVVTINGENDPPIAVGPLILSATEDQLAVFPRSDLVAVFVDPDTALSELFVSRVVSGTGGTVTRRVDGGVDFTPAAHFNGLASFFLYVSDGIDESAPLEAKINVSAVEDAPNVSIRQVIGEALQTVTQLRPGMLLRAEVLDPDGLPDVLSFRWYANGVAISGANGRDLLVADSLVGAKIGVSVAYTDLGGTEYEHRTPGGQGTPGSKPSATALLGMTVESGNSIPTLVAPDVPLALTGDVGGSLSASLASRFLDPDVGDVLSFSARLLSGAPLPAGLSIDPSTGVLSGTLGAGWLGEQKVRITATDSSGASVSEIVTITTGAPPGIYLADSKLLIRDFDLPSSGSASAFLSAETGSVASGRFGVVFSSEQGGQRVGSELSRPNLRALLDGDPSTGTAPSLLVPIRSTLITPVDGSLSLALGLPSLPGFTVSVTLNVSFEVDPSGKLSLKAKGNQSVPLVYPGGQASQVSFVDGEVLGEAVALGGVSNQALELNLMSFLSRLSPTVADFVSPFLQGALSFSVDFAGLPVFDEFGRNLSGLDVSAVVADSPNRPPALSLSLDNAQPALVLPVGSTLGLGEILKLDLGADPDGAFLLLGRPTAGRLLLDGSVLLFPDASATSLPTGFVRVDGQPMFKISGQDLSRIAYTAPAMAGSSTFTEPELAGLIVQAMDGKGAKSSPVLYRLGLDGQIPPVMLMGVGEADRLIDLNGDALINGDGSIAVLFGASFVNFQSSVLKVVALPAEAFGTLSRRNGASADPLKVGDIVSLNDVLSFDPGDNRSQMGSLRNVVLFELLLDGQRIYRRFDLQLSEPASFDPLSLVLDPLVTTVAENTIIASPLDLATITIASVRDVNLTLSGLDRDLFVLDSSGTKLQLKAYVSLDYETRSSYFVQINVDDPLLGLPGSIESSVMFELKVGNVADTIELDSNTVTVIDAGRTLTASGNWALVNGKGTLSFQGLYLGATPDGLSPDGLSLPNLRALFDGDPATGISPVIQFDLGETSDVVSGLHTVHVTALLTGEILGLSLPLEMSFSSQIALQNDSGGLKAVLPSQIVDLHLRAAGFEIATLPLNNVDSDLFQIGRGTNVTPSFSLKLLNLIDKASDNLIPLNQLGNTGALALVGAIVAGGLGSKTLEDLVGLAKDVVDLPPSISGSTLGRLIDVLRATVEVPESLRNISFAQIADLGTALLNLSEGTVGELLELARDAVTLPSSLVDITLTQFKARVVQHTGDPERAERAEALIRELLDDPTGDLGGLTLTELLDRVELTAAAMNLSDFAASLTERFGQYSAVDLLSDLLDVVRGVYGDRTAGEGLAKLMDVLSLPDPSATLGDLPLIDVLDLGRTLLAVGQLLVGGSGLTGVPDLLSGSDLVGSVIRLVQDSVTIDGQINGKSLAEVLQIFDQTFDLDRAFEGRYDLSDLIRDLNTDTPSVPLGPMVLLAGNALFSSEAKLLLSVDVSGMGLLDASEQVIDRIAIETLLVNPQPIPIG